MTSKEPAPTSNPGECGRATAFACAHLGARERMGMERVLYLLRERLTQPPSVAGEAIEWKEIRLVGASERLGCFVRCQYEPVRSRAAVCVARENVNGSFVRRRGMNEKGDGQFCNGETRERPIHALWRHVHAHVM